MVLDLRVKIQTKRAQRSPIAIGRRGHKETDETHADYAGSA